MLMIALPTPKSEMNTTGITMFIFIHVTTEIFNSKTENVHILANKHVCLPVNVKKIFISATYQSQYLAQITSYIKSMA